MTVGLGFSPYISVSVALGFSPIHLYVSGIGVFLIQLCVSGIGVFPIQLCQSVTVRVLPLDSSNPSALRARVVPISCGRGQEGGGDGGVLSSER